MEKKNLHECVEMAESEMEKRVHNAKIKQNNKNAERYCAQNAEIVTVLCIDLVSKTETGRERARALKSHNNQFARGINEAYKKKNERKRNDSFFPNENRFHYNKQNILCTATIVLTCFFLFLHSSCSKHIFCFGIRKTQNAKYI